MRCHGGHQHAGRLVLALVTSGSAVVHGQCGSICTNFFDACPADSGTELVCGESVSNSLDGLDDRKVFTFFGDAGDVVALYLSYTIVSSEEPVIDLCPPSGSALIVTENRAPVVVELPETGIYDVVVRTPVVLGAADFPTVYDCWSRVDQSSREGL